MIKFDERFESLKNRINWYIGISFEWTKKS